MDLEKYFHDKNHFILFDIPNKNIPSNYSGPTLEINQRALGEIIRHKGEITRRSDPKIRLKKLRNILINFCHPFAKKCNFRNLYYRTILFELNAQLPHLLEILADSREYLKYPIPILERGVRRSIWITNRQIFILMVNAFFGTLQSSYKSIPSLHLFSLFDHTKFDDAKRSQVKLEKLKCILNYFRRNLESSEIQSSVISFERRVISPEEFPNWGKSTTSLIDIELRNGRIEECKGMLQVDFANKIIGGGILENGAVQEEILFAINPELILARGLAEKMGDNEVVIIKGVEQFNSYSGYSERFRFEGDFVDATPLDELKMRKTEIVAMDAINFNLLENGAQFQEYYIQRELNKAYCGFAKSTTDENKPIATGNWGCGVFGGNPELKFLIQLMAASEARRPLMIMNSGDERNLLIIYRCLKSNQISVGQLYKVIMEYGSYKGANKSGLFDFISARINDQGGISKISQMELEGKNRQLKQKLIKLGGRYTLLQNQYKEEHRRRVKAEAELNILQKKFYKMFQSRPE